ncbi:anthranilate phosphoribosyltransferase [Mesorhizobium sp. INR15]|uniref:anthranilate phosphoribosyltransferase n=1 Tax=Mesorhizobium sp. INR15 TaxID=2654248 RepID=UPI00189653C7|nr:anthranilate phosphoribosyltransferase [Mesorhizobium sp. INR15]
MSSPPVIEDLSTAEAEQQFTAILDGDMPLDEAGALLVALSRKGETEEEILGCVRSMMKRVAPTDLDGPDAIDIGGTGGDRLGTFNISTTTAFVVAAAGLPVLKHGNRGFSSRSGSADMIEALGISLSAWPDHEHVRACLAEVGMAYLFTPTHHRFPEGLNALRKRLCIRTIFNLAGPLAHPARLRRQMIGVSDPTLLPVFCNVLARSGRKQAWIFHGADGADEISVSGRTTIHELRNGQFRVFSVSPEDFGIVPSPVTALRGGDGVENAAICRDILAGAPGPKTDAVLICAASAFVFAGLTSTLLDGMAAAREAIGSGAAARVLIDLREASHDRRG